MSPQKRGEVEQMSEMNAMQKRQFRRVVGRRHARRADVQRLWLDCRHLADHETWHRQRGLVITAWRPYWGRVDREGLMQMARFALLTGSGMAVGRLRDGSGIGIVLARRVG